MENTNANNTPEQEVEQVKDVVEQIEQTLEEKFMAMFKQIIAREVEAVIESDGVLDKLNQLIENEVDHAVRGSDFVDESDVEDIVERRIDDALSNCSVEFNY